jgi:hypothetical protein
MTAGFTIEELRPVAKPGVLRGWVTVLQPSGQRIHDCGVYCKDGRWWVSPPSKPRIGRDGQQMKDAAGKLRWDPLVSFASRELESKWSNAVLDALRQAHPHTLDEVAPQA